MEKTCSSIGVIGKEMITEREQSRKEAKNRYQNEAKKIERDN